VIPQRHATSRIGLLGGSFNPAHDGHREISLLALKRLGLDAVWWLVSPGNPLKDARDYAPYHERLQTARQVADHPRIIISNFEERKVFSIRSIRLRPCAICGRRSTLSG